ncbi:vacuolar protein-sorting-associated protein 37 homolog 1-like [Tasmannia lanceolata]|uniref:vacuolar protein-sorting-associated protein 37 homolog 1-like n=1 Tax=Tasmannia lanceolata TaxID=3420 RepID=UPI00406400A6
MFKSFWGSQEQENRPNLQEIPTQSWYPPPSTVSSSPNSSRPSTPNSSSSLNAHQRGSSHGQPSPTETSSITGLLRDKDVEELRKLINDKDAYSAFFHSLDQVKLQNSIGDELRKETTQLARENLEKEPRILELRNQCRIIRTTELATAQEKLIELERQKDEILKFCAPSRLLQRMQDAMDKVEEESEILHRQFLNKEIDLAAFVQKYKRLRTVYHRRALVQLAAKTSSTG